MRVIHDDFLTYSGYKKYDLIIMNPPFSDGDKHLLKAMQIQKDGGNIICILNAETIRNTFSISRKELKQQLENYNAEITFHKEMFKDSERKTDVEVAIIKVHIPKKEQHSFIYDELKKAKMCESDYEKDMTELAVNDYIKAIVKQCEIETEACLKLIREYRALKPYILEDIRENTYTKPILELCVTGEKIENNTENKVLEIIRMKYWKALFNDERFTKNMTSKQRNDYRSKINELRSYDFSYYNIKTIQEQMTKNLIKGIEECIISLFDELSHEYSWLPETGRNIHYYSGWATNKAHIINKKVIIPMHGIFSDIWKKFEYK